MQTSVRLMTRLICTIPTPYSYWTALCNGHQHHTCDYSYREAVCGGRVRIQLRSELYTFEDACAHKVPIKLSQNYLTIFSPYSSVVCNVQISCKVRLCSSNRYLNHMVPWRTRSCLYQHTVSPILLFWNARRLHNPHPPKNVKRCLRPDMAEKLFTGTLSLKTTNTTKRFAIIIKPHYE